jgi:hypothetical protein
MTEPHVLESEVHDVKDWINEKVAKATRQVHECVRFVDELHAWMRYEQHLIDSCDRPGCDDCNARTWLLNRLTSLRIPALEASNRRAEHGGEDGDARHASDPGRPGLVTEEEPGGSETGGGFNP